MTGATSASGVTSAYLLQSLQSTANASGNNLGVSSTAPGTAGATTAISSAGQLLSNLQQLQSQDPAKFKQVVGQIATELQNAAQQQGSTPAGSYVANLAAKFQSVANGGSLSQLQPHHHAHHGHRTYNKNGQAVPSSSTSSTSSPANDTDQLLATLASQVAQALRS